MNRNELTRYIDQTTLKPGMSRDYVAEFCRNAKENHFASVCVLSNMIETAAEALKDSDTKVCTVTNFPLGLDWPNVKIHKTKNALDKGAQEIDLVMNVSTLKSERYDIMTEELDGTIKASYAREVIIKLIIETSLLTNDQVVKVCDLAEQHNVDMVKTPTGFSAILSRSTSVDDVKLIRSSVKPETGIKAAGGIRTTTGTLTMIKAGATRIDASAGEEIIGGL